MQILCFQATQKVNWDSEKGTHRFHRKHKFGYFEKLFLFSHVLLHAKVYANDKYQYQITSDIQKTFHKNNFYGDGNLSHIKLCKKVI